MNKKYIVELMPEERKQLQNLVRKGKAAAYKIEHANILLTVDAEGPAHSDEQTARTLHCHANTVRNLRQRFVQRGLEGCLARKKQEQPSRQRVLDGEQEAHLIAPACSAAPEGRVRWTLKLLAQKLVELEVVDSISDQTVRRVLKKTLCSRTGASAGASLRNRTVSS